MARPKQTDSESGSGDPKADPKGGKSFKPETGKFDTLKEKESVTGTFMGAKHQTITDRRTKMPKQIFVLKLRDDTENVLKIPAAAMMLQAWEDLVDEYGNGDENQAITRLRGVKMTLNRGEDSRTKDGNVLGSYEIIVWEE